MKNYLNLFFRGIRFVKTFKNFNVLFGNYFYPDKNKNQKTKEMILWNGIRFKIKTEHLNTDSNVIYEIWKKNCYKVNKKDFVEREGNIIIDIGAHIGIFSVLCSFIKQDALILSFEPDLENFSLLKKNIILNKSENNIKPFPICVSGSDTMKILYKSKKSIGHTITPNEFIIKNEIQASHKVPCITLEQIFTGEKIKLCDFLKIDCEGSEYDILLNTPSEIFKKIKKISLEYHNGLTKHNHKELVKLLKNEGFKVSFLKNKKLPFIETGYLYAVNQKRQ